MSETRTSPERPASLVLTENGQPDGANRVEQPSRVRPALLLAVLLPAVAAFALLYKVGISVPYQDDYGVILAFATEYDQLPTLWAKVLDVATKQNNDYKLAFAHSIVAAEMELTRHLNFGFLVSLGNLLLLPIAYLIWQSYQMDEANWNRRLIQFLPISILFFSLTYWETLNWAMAGLQNLSVILFSLLAIRLLIPKKAPSPRLPGLLLACLSATLAAFCSANGFLLAPLGLLILLRRRNFVACLLWCASFLLPMAAYLYHYVPYHYSVHILHTASYISRIFYFFAFLGCAIPLRRPAALLGILISAVIALAVHSRFERRHPVPFYFTVWVLATSLLVAWLRGAIGSRYSIYSILLLIFCYSFLAEYLPSRFRFEPKQFYRISIVLAVTLCLGSDLNAYLYLSRRRQMILSGIEHYRVRPEVNSPMIDPAVAKISPEEEAFERVTLSRAIEQHVYSLPPEH
jgi:hypothetical protein